MLAVAAAGIAVNAGIAALMWRGRRDLNLRTVLVHNAGDAASSAAILVGALLIARTGWVIVDALLSFAIGAAALGGAPGRPPFGRRHSRGRSPHRPHRLGHRRRALELRHRRGGAVELPRHPPRDHTHPARRHAAGLESRRSGAGDAAGAGGGR